MTLFYPQIQEIIFLPALAPKRDGVLIVKQLTTEIQFKNVRSIQERLGDSHTHDKHPEKLRQLASICAAC